MATGIQRRYPVWEAQDLSTEEMSGLQKRRWFLQAEECKKSTASPGNRDGEGEAHIINHLLWAGNFIFAFSLLERIRIYPQWNMKTLPLAMPRILLPLALPSAGPQLSCGLLQHPSWSPAVSPSDSPSMQLPEGLFYNPRVNLSCLGLESFDAPHHLRLVFKTFCNMAPSCIAGPSPALPEIYLYTSTPCSCCFFCLDAHLPSCLLQNAGLPYTAAHSSLEMHSGPISDASLPGSPHACRL